METREIILPSLRSHVPGVSKLEPKPTWHLPIHVHHSGHIDLDFGPLLLFDRATMDASSVAYIESAKRPELEPLRQSISYLQNEGFIGVIDFHSKLQEVRPAIAKHVDRLLHDPLPLRAPLMRGIDQYRLTLPSWQDTGYQADDPLLNLGFGMHLLMMGKYGHVNLEEKDRLDKLMVSRKQRWTRQELADVRSLVRPTLTNLYQNVALGEMLGMPFIDVDYTSELYQIIQGESLLAFKEKSQLDMREIEETQRMFQFVIPELRPSSASAMLAFLRSSALTDFRDYIFQAAKDGKTITQNDYVSLLANTLHVERKYQNLMSKFSWGERVVSLVPGAGLVASGVSMLAKNLLFRKTRKKNEWLYALIKSSRVAEK